MNGDAREVEKGIANLDGSIGCVVGALLCLCVVLSMGFIALYAALQRIADKI